VATSTSTSVARPRRLTQPERSAATRQALLESTIECLVELGYDRTTTAEISERAALSRGAHLHHFRTRAALLAAAAQELVERGTADLEHRVQRLPAGAKRVPAALDMIWKLFTGPLFSAVLELAIHARTDPELKADLDPLERRINRDAMPWLRTAFERAPDDPSFDGPITLVSATIRGLAIMPLLDPDYDAARHWRVARAMLIELLTGS
jgi:AcrR family transcriptional regulator